MTQKNQEHREGRENPGLEDNPQSEEKEVTRCLNEGYRNAHQLYVDITVSSDQQEEHEESPMLIKFLKHQAVPVGWKQAVNHSDCKPQPVEVIPACHSSSQWGHLRESSQTGKEKEISMVKDYREINMPADKPMQVAQVAAYELPDWAEDKSLPSGWFPGSYDNEHISVMDSVYGNSVIPVGGRTEVNDLPAGWMQFGNAQRSDIALPAVSLVTSRSCLTPGGERSFLLDYEKDANGCSQEEGLQLGVREQLGQKAEPGTAATLTDTTNPVNRKSKTADKSNLPAGWKAQKSSAMAAHHPHGDITMAVSMTDQVAEVRMAEEGPLYTKTDSEAAKVAKDERSGWTEETTLPAGWFLVTQAKGKKQKRTVHVKTKSRKSGSTGSVIQVLCQPYLGQDRLFVTKHIDIM